MPPDSSLYRSPPAPSLLQPTASDISALVSRAVASSDRPDAQWSPPSQKHIVQFARRLAVLQSIGTLNRLGSQLPPPLSKFAHSSIRGSIRNIKTHDTSARRLYRRQPTKMRPSLFTLAVFALFIAVVAAWSKEGTSPRPTPRFCCPIY